MANILKMDSIDIYVEGNQEPLEQPSEQKSLKGILGILCSDGTIGTHRSQ